ncbi:MAG: hypothetical protein ACOCVA_09390 [Prolixibacteraceae bacterium]
MKAKNQHQKKFLFWQQWLFYSSLLFAAYGLILAFYSNNPLLAPYFELIAQNFWNQPEFPDAVTDFKAFVLGPLGGSIAFCSILVAYIAKYPFKNKERWARNAILVASLFWFITDSAVSLFYGAYLQGLVLNTLSLAIRLLPLLFTWKEFNARPDRQA